MTYRLLTSLRRLRSLPRDVFGLLNEINANVMLLRGGRSIQLQSATRLPIADEREPADPRTEMAAFIQEMTGLAGDITRLLLQMERAATDAALRAAIVQRAVERVEQATTQLLERLDGTAPHPSVTDVNGFAAGADRTAATPAIASPAVCPRN